MLDLIKRKLSLKVSLTLTAITIPLMIVAGYTVTQRDESRLQDLTFERARIVATTGAKMYATVLEAGLDAAAFKPNDLFEPVYEEIKGFDFGENPRFHTKYDFYTDHTVAAFQDEFLAGSPDFLLATATDINGYVPTHNSRYQQPLTGDRAKDLVGNRTKRKFDQPIGLKAAHNLEPVLVQPYTLDTGAAAWDVSAPIFVRGRHFGAFRVVVSIASLAASKRTLMLELLALFSVLAIVTVGSIFLMLRRAMKPLEHLAHVGNEISLGEGLDQPLEAKTSDEIGQMAKSMDRLRASLQVAMSRLGE